jgi:SAM-dependent methyltransferase
VERVGPTGSVLAVDLAENLLALGREKAARRGLGHIEFRRGDLLDLRLPDARFDAVVCVFGIFFVTDMPAAVRALWRLVRPAGTLAITTWGPRFFEPATTIFWDAVRAVRPDLHRAFNPWDRVSDPASLAALMREGGVDGADVVAEAGEHAIRTPEDWWSAVRGSGYRGTLDQLDPDQQERVRRTNLDEIRRSGIVAVEANVVYAMARRPGASPTRA